MEFIDGSKVHIYPAEDEKPHAAGSQENWQESFVLYWYDFKQRIGGNFRLGREPNYKGGQSQFNIIIVSPEGIYRHCGNVALRPDDLFENGISAGDGLLRYAYEGGKIRWTMKAADVEARFDVDPYVPPLNPHRKAGIASSGAILSAHVDAACQVVGTMVIKGKTYEVDTLGLRDHAWGTRDLSALRSYRWLNASFGKDDSFVAMTFLSANDTMDRVGWVIRGDKVILARSVSTRTIVSDDGGTNLGGAVRMILTTGEVFEAKFEPLCPTLAVDLTFVHPVSYYDAFCRVRWGEKTGFGIFESGNNIRGGTLLPKVFDGSVGTNGWHPDAKPFFD